MPRKVVAEYPKLLALQESTRVAAHVAFRTLRNELRIEDLHDCNIADRTTKTHRTHSARLLKVSPALFVETLSRASIEEPNREEAELSMRSRAPRLTDTTGL